MQLSIINTKGQSNFDIDWVELNTVVGNLVVQEGHVPSVLFLAPNSAMHYKSIKKNQPESITIKQAIAHITRTDVTIIITE